MPINCLQTVLSYLGSNADLHTLIAGRIASKHKFAQEGSPNAWPKPSKAIQAIYDPGETPDLDGGTERARLDVRCYGERPEEAAKVYDRLMVICDAFVRTTVQTADGKGVLYFLHPATSARSDRDPDLGVDFIQVFLTTSVHRTPVD